MSRISVQLGGLQPPSSPPADPSPTLMVVSITKLSSTWPFFGPYLLNFGSAEWEWIKVCIQCFFHDSHKASSIPFDPYLRTYATNRKNLRTFQFEKILWLQIIKY